MLPVRTVLGAELGERVAREIMRNRFEISVLNSYYFKNESRLIQTKPGPILSLVAILQKGREKAGGPTGRGMCLRCT